MTYIVSAYLDGHWTRLLATRDRAYAMAFRRGIRGLKTKIETVP
jgi:hypothetical protein